MPRPSGLQQPRLSITDPRYRIGRRPANYGKTYPVEVLNPAEVHQLLAACPENRKHGVRNRAMIVLLWRSGLRVAELVALEPKDLDMAAGTITVLRGKGLKRRAVGIDPHALAMLRPWLELRRTLDLPPGSPLFVTVLSDRFGRPLHTAYVRDMLKELAEKAGIEKRVHPHGMRHTHAFELANEGVPLHLIQLQLGHESLATTERYIRHLAPVHLLRTMRARSWPEEAPPDLEAA